ncbi:MAG TPA: ABC transporter ATP-binding protein [Pseudobdellovibrionaceae bacterium]|jgi:Cu-processing system ATP-binding protein
MMNQAMIEIKNLYKAYRMQSALAGVTLSVRRGTITGLVGPNGCGKTTLIKSILGLVVPDEGEVRVADKSISEGPLYRELIGYMPQNPDFPSNLSIYELLEMLEDVRGRRAPNKHDLLKLFDLDSQQTKTFGTLSGGTKQKVAAVAAFMFTAPILILDEPTVGLDPISANRLKALAKSHAKEGAAILLVSHIMSEMEHLVDQMTFLLEGKVSFSGSTSELLLRAQASSLENAVVKLIGQRMEDPQGVNEAVK